MLNLTYTTELPINPTIEDVNSTNHSPWLLGWAYGMLVLSLMSTFIKTFSQHKSTSRLKISDLYIITSSLFAVFQTITITIAVHLGLGRHQSSLLRSRFESFEKAYYASNMIMIPALAAASASVAHLLIEISPTKRMQHLCYVVIGLTAAWALASVLCLALQCTPPKPWEVQSTKCVNQHALVIAIYSVNAMIVLFLISTAFVVMQKVQISSRKRWTLRGLFASRITVLGFTIVILYYTRDIYRSDNRDFTWEVLMPQVFVQIMLNASIMTACLPSLRPFSYNSTPGLIISRPTEHELTTTPYARPSTSGSKMSAKNSPLPTPGFNNRSSASTKRSNTMTSRISHKSSSSTMKRTNTMTSRISTGSRMSRKPRIEKERQSQAVSDMERGHNRPRAIKAESKIEHGRSESNQCLTDDVILHYIDYRVEYEDVSDDIDAQLDRIERAHPVSRG